MTADAPITTDGQPLRRHPSTETPVGWDPNGIAARFLACALSPIRQYQAVALGEAFIGELRGESTPC